MNWVGHSLPFIPVCLLNVAVHPPPSHRRRHTLFPISMPDPAKDEIYSKIQCCHCVLIMSPLRLPLFFLFLKARNRLAVPLLLISSPILMLTEKLPNPAHGTAKNWPVWIGHIYANASFRNPLFFWFAYLHLPYVFVNEFRLVLTVHCFAIATMSIFHFL